MDPVLMKAIRNGVTPEQSLEDFLTRMGGAVSLGFRMQIILCRPEFVMTGQETKGLIDWQTLSQRWLDNDMIRVLEENGAVVLHGLPGDTRDTLYEKLRLRLIEIEEAEDLARERGEGKELIQ